MKKICFFAAALFISGTAFGQNQFWSEENETSAAPVQQFNSGLGKAPVITTADPFLIIGPASAQTEKQIPSFANLLSPAADFSVNNKAKTPVNTNWRNGNSVNPAPASPTCDLFFSEYLEGASNNKAIEFYNPTTSTVNLSDYKIYRYNNGSPTPTDSLQPVGTLAPGAVFVAGNPSAIAAILNVSDTLHTITFFNGDDVLELRYMPTNTSLDIIGVIGVDPGTNWVVGTGATSEFTLVRNVTITHGTTSWTQSVNEWDVYPQNTTTFIGAHTANACCGTTAVSVASQNDLLCFGDNSGSILLNVSGGNSYTYNWSPVSDTDGTLSGLTAGLYTCIVVNECSSSDTISVQINEPADLTQSLSASTDAGCFLSDGSLSISVAGGTPGYTYSWSNSATVANPQNLAAGTYTCSVTDTNGCVDTASYTVATGPSPVVTLSLTNPDTVCNILSAFTLGGESPAGGTWAGPGVSGNMFDPSQAGIGWNLINYFYTASNNCAGSATDSIYVEICMGIANTSSINAISIYPNPAQNELFVETAENGNLIITDALGKIVFAQQITAGRNQISTGTIANGVYEISISNGQTISSRKLVISR